MRTSPHTVVFCFPVLLLRVFLIDLKRFSSKNFLGGERRDEEELHAFFRFAFRVRLGDGGFTRVFPGVLRGAQASML